MTMDHRDSFGKTLFDVRNDDPDDTQLAAMKSAKQLIFEGLREAVPLLSFGHAGVLVDERYGQGVIDKAIAGGTPVMLAVPIMASCPHHLHRAMRCARDQLLVLCSAISRRARSRSRSSSASMIAACRTCRSAMYSGSG